MKYEYKYVIPNELQEILRSRLAPFLEQDAFMAKGGKEGYTLRSVYYDTEQLDYYVAKNKRI